MRNDGGMLVTAAAESLSTCSPPSVPPACRSASSCVIARACGLCFTVSRCEPPIDPRGHPSHRSPGMPLIGQLSDFSTASLDDLAE